MKWFDRFVEWSWQRQADKQFEEGQKEKQVIDMMKDDVDPEEVTIENAYKTRWIWYHTILAIGIFLTNVLLISILTLLAIKL